MTRTIKCPRCDKMFKDEHGLKCHRADAHKEGNRPRDPERYPSRFDDADVNAEYEPRQFRAGAYYDDY